MVDLVELGLRFGQEDIQREQLGLRERQLELQEEAAATAARTSGDIERARRQLASDDPALRAQAEIDLATLNPQLSQAVQQVKASQDAKAQLQFAQAARRGLINAKRIQAGRTHPERQKIARDIAAEEAAKPNPDKNRIKSLLDLAGADENKMRLQLDKRVLEAQKTEDILKPAERFETETFQGRPTGRKINMVTGEVQGSFLPGFESVAQATQRLVPERVNGRLTGRMVDPATGQRSGSFLPGFTTKPEGIEETDISVPEIVDGKPTGRRINKATGEVQGSFFPGFTTAPAEAGEQFEPELSNGVPTGRRINKQTGEVQGSFLPAFQRAESKPGKPQRVFTPEVDSEGVETGRSIDQFGKPEGSFFPNYQKPDDSGLSGPAKNIVSARRALENGQITQDICRAPAGALQISRGS